MRARRIVLAIAECALFACSPFLSGQQTEWDRFIAEGDSASSRKQYAEAEQAYRHALQYATIHLKKDARLSVSSIKLAEACETEGKKDEAEGLAHRAMEELSEALKRHKPKNASEELMQADVAVGLLTKAGDLFQANERFGDAETAYQQAITIREHYAAWKPATKPNNEDFFRFMAQALSNAQAQVADARDKLGVVYRREQKFQQAEEQFQKSEAIREEVFGPDQPPVAQSLSDLGMCYALQGHYEQAVPLYQRVAAILENSKLRESPEMAAALENYSLVLRKAGKEQEAGPITAKARKLRSKLQNSPDTPK